MQTISVFLQQDNQQQCQAFRSIIDSLKEKLQTEPVTIEVREGMRAGDTRFQFVSWCQEEYTLETRDIVRSFVALVVTDYVLQVMEPQLVKRCLHKEIQSDLSNKWEEILPYVQFVFHEQDEIMEQLEPNASRKMRIYRTVVEYLQEENEMNLDGFIRFRLKDYWAELYEAMQSGIDQYVQDKEYQEFVELLRYFVSMQETRYPLVHVVEDKQKQFLLYDETDELIPLEEIEAVLGLSEQECREEDYLVSALITLAPEKIILHLDEEKQALLETLRSIFGKRISICNTCAYCLTNRSALDLNTPSLYNK
ncbi:putative sporulation protein YtxC [Brevibacillus dissolubilis]|uniref:putative sporulation protein YtxC n=1 Tax=Brevibacillus dissolubilis TaxID=1844116 RepID=UPI001115B58B|nr:putative sporulation protein YtxC [Brevibacillus dissolubilis]